MTSNPELKAEIGRGSAMFERVKAQVHRLIVGQDRLLDRLLVALLADGHVLIEGVPGLAKSLTVSSLAAALGLPFRRIQFTPDLLPADIVGTLIYRPDAEEFAVKRGPIFTSLLLADEINRAPPKVQSALLEAMQERQVSLGDESHPLPQPFLVLATQNPLEQEGTYPLPEAEVDRFLLKVRLDYPTVEEERNILLQHALTRPLPALEAVTEAAEILAARSAVDRVHVDARIFDYVLRLVQATRHPAEAGLPELASLLRVGVSPRGSLALLLAAKAHALLCGREYVSPHDVKSVAVDALAHRLGVTYECESMGQSGVDLVQQVLDRTAVP